MEPATFANGPLSVRLRGRCECPLLALLRCQRESPRMRVSANPPPTADRRDPDHAPEKTAFLPAAQNGETAVSIRSTSIRNRWAVSLT